jgi:hypothetical protein
VGGFGFTLIYGCPGEDRRIIHCSQAHILNANQVKIGLTQA